MLPIRLYPNLKSLPTIKYFNDNFSINISFINTFSLISEKLLSKGITNTCSTPNFSNTLYLSDISINLKKSLVLKYSSGIWSNVNTVGTKLFSFAIRTFSLTNSI